MEFHVTSIGGHLGITKTIHRLQSNFYWNIMCQDVKKFIREYSICQQTKTSTQRPTGLLQPLPIPIGVWEDLSLDFITHLPSSHGFTIILVAVDSFSKGVHFGALPTTYSAFKVVSLFMDIVCKLQGFPRSIVFDRDPIFIILLWRELFYNSGTHLRLSKAYHPQTDSQIEVMNHVLELYLH